LLSLEYPPAEDKFDWQQMNENQILLGNNVV